MRSGRPDDRVPSADSRDVADPDRPTLRRRDVWRLVWATYAATLPLLFVFLLGLALATWIVTELIF